MGKTPPNQRPERPVFREDPDGTRWVQWPSVGQWCRIDGPREFERERGMTFREFCEQQDR